MSGTSLDGIDAVLVEFIDGLPGPNFTWSTNWSAELRQQLLALNTPGVNELHSAALISNALADCYALTVQQLLSASGLAAHEIRAIGCHGQTVRHRPEAGYSIQLGNAARLAELTNITVVGDFRSRDIAAGGQGAPLVPAFHHAVFYSAQVHRVIVNVGGIANLTNLPPNGSVSGFDCGPGNLLMDAWIKKHRQSEFDAEGNWAASGKVLPALLNDFLADPYFELAPPKSSGRDLFNFAWLETHLRKGCQPQDVQATLLQLTAETIARAAEKYCGGVKEIYLCGGGAYNSHLLLQLRLRLPTARIALTDELKIPAQQVEALAFAWLAKQTMESKPGNMPSATGAEGLRILGAIYLA